MQSQRIPTSVPNSPPTQALAAAWAECLGENLRGRTLLLRWVRKGGDNLDPHDVLLTATRLGMEVLVAHPTGAELDPEALRLAEDQAVCWGGRLTVSDQVPAEDADLVVRVRWDPPLLFAV